MIKQKQTAFTLVELVMTIVILGILAAFALPRFADLSGDANAAVMDTVRSSFVTAVNIARSKSLVNRTAAGFPDVSLEGTCIQIDSLSGFPLIDQTTGTCTAVASIEGANNLILIESFAQQLINTFWSTRLFTSTIQAAPPPPPPPVNLTGELPSLILGSDFVDWVWSQSAPTATMTSPEGLSFTYNQSTGEVN